MKANSNSPEDRAESIDSRELADNWRMLDDEPDELVALVMEGQEEETKEVVADLSRALLNDDVPLTDEKVARLSTLGNALRSISDTLGSRVPEDQRASVNLD